MEMKFYPGWRDMVVYSDDDPQPQAMLDDEGVKVVVAGLMPGQKIPPHPEAKGVFYILEGSGWMTVDEERLAVEAGATVFVPDGGARGFEAKTQMTFMAIRISS